MNDYTHNTHTENVQRLFVKNTSLIKGFITGLLPDFNAADDIFQEVFIIVTSKSGSFRDGTDFMAWVRAIAKRKILEYYRSSNREHIGLDPDIMETVTEAASKPDIKTAVLKQALAYCLEKLPPRLKELMHLRYFKAFTPSQISNAVSWTLNAVHVGLSRARSMLHDCTEHRLNRRET